jgi:hypothetical protein
MPRLSLIPQRHDPFWDLDGKAARRSRSVRTVVHLVLAVLAVVFLAFVASRVSSFDPGLVTSNGSLRPVLAVALLSLLAACILVAGARIRGHGTHA